MSTQTNKIALITGASRGLGKDTALRLAQTGVNIILTYREQQQEAEDVVVQLQKLGVEAATVQYDQGDSKAIEALTASLQEIASAWGRDTIDILINNAGVSSNQAFGYITENELDRLYQINYRNLVLLTQAVSPLIEDGGRIVTLGTGLTRTAFSPMIVYAAMKSALETFTQYLAQDLGSRGITVNAVAPGGIDNDFNAERFEKMPEVKDYIRSQTALGRIGKPDDIGPIIAFLCSDQAGWITGQRIEASGGFKL